MTWAEYKVWRTEAQQLVSAALDKARLSVSGPGLSLQDGRLIARALPVEDTYTKPVPTWGLQVWMRVRLKGVGEATQQGAEIWKPMATLSRAGNLFPGTDVQALTFFNLPPDEDTPKSVTREIELEASVRSYEPGFFTSYEQSLYRLPVRLTLAVMRRLPDNTYVEDRTEDFLLRRASQKKKFTAQKPNTFYELVVKSITKI